MDPCARRNIWEVLRRKRLGRTTLLSTHFMDEAELLSDRIAVLRDGNLLCSGTPLFLKERHGLGYNLTAVVEDSSPATVDSTSESLANDLLAFVNQYIPKAEIGRISGKEVLIRMPPGNEDMFPACFDALEKQREDLRVGAFGIQNASLEEVFLRLARHEESEERIGDTGDSRTKYSEEDDDESSRTEYLSPLKQIFLLYRKRVIIQKRDITGLFTLLVVPVFIIALSMLTLTVTLFFPWKSIEMSMNLYQSPDSPEGTPSMDVLIGGGNFSKATTTPLYKDLVQQSNTQYPFVHFVHLPTNKSSSDMSKYLYQSINEHEHNPRYGAFVFNDTIEMKAAIDWPQLFDALEVLAVSGEGQAPWKIQAPVGKIMTSSFDLSSLFRSKSNKFGSAPFDAVSEAEVE